jgi:arginine decarboxylase
VGAYQEILGDLHNLFGDTHAVHVDIVNGQQKISSIVKGDTVSEVLSYVQYEAREVMENVQSQIEDAISGCLINDGDAGKIGATFSKAMAGYTYLTQDRANYPSTESLSDRAALSHAVRRAKLATSQDPCGHPLHASK